LLSSNHDEPYDPILAANGDHSVIDDKRAFDPEGTNDEHGNLGGADPISTYHDHGVVLGAPDSSVSVV